MVKITRARLNIIYRVNGSYWCMSCLTTLVPSGKNHIWILYICIKLHQKTTFDRFLMQFDTIWQKYSKWHMWFFPNVTPPPLYSVHYWHKDSCVKNWGLHIKMQVNWIKRLTAYQHTTQSLKEGRLSMLVKHTNSSAMISLVVSKNFLAVMTSYPISSSNLKDTMLMQTEQFGSTVTCTLGNSGGKYRCV